MKKFLKEFKEFALRGNVMDLAVAVIIGAAFQAIISSLVEDVFSPLIGLIAKTDLSFLVLNIRGVDIKYGSFLTALINFILIAFCIFLLIKGLNKIASIGKKPVVEEKTTKTCPFCQSEISIKATRCPHCTSELPLPVEEPEEEKVEEKVEEQADEAEGKEEEKKETEKKEAPQAKNNQKGKSNRSKRR